MDRNRLNQEEYNMKIGPKYKIARRLGAQIFEKTQTAKYAASESKKMKNKRNFRPRTDYGIQILEKQKARFTYGITEKQFSNYAKETFKDRGDNKAEMFFEKLERRLDNVVYRAGFAKTRRAARQIVSHGHVKVNDKKNTVPSHRVSEKDVVTIKESGAILDREEEMTNYHAPSWMKSDMKKKQVVIEGAPKLDKQDVLFDLDAVLEFYSR